MHIFNDMNRLNYPQGPFALGGLIKSRVLFIVIALLMMPINSISAPYLPKDPSSVLETVASSRDANSNSLRQLRAQLLKAPEDEQIAITFSRQSIAQARRLGDPRYLGYAEAALKKWFDLPQPNPEILLLRASIKESKHDFAGALQDLDYALKSNPKNNQAWLNRANILTVQGEYEQAIVSCKRVHGVSPLISATCLSSTASLHGKAHQSYLYLQKIIVDSSQVDPSIKVWSLNVLADIAARLGKNIEAERYYKEALSIDDQDSYLLGAYADFLLDSARNDEVIKLLNDHRRVDGLLLRLTIAKLRTNNASLQQDINETSARFAANRLRGDDSIHLREESRFNLHVLKKPEQAYKLAKENWQVQKEPWDHRLILEAAIESNQKNEISIVRNWLAKKKLEDQAIQKLLKQ